MNGKSAIITSNLLRVVTHGAWRLAGVQLQRIAPLGAQLCSVSTFPSSSSAFSCLSFLPRPTGTSLRLSVARLSSSPQTTTKQNVKTVNVTFKDRDGDVHTVKAKIGDSLLEVAKEHDIDLEGACDGTLSCSTCHLIVDPEWFDKITDPLTEEEEDMLDLAYGLSDTSRLGCQVIVTESLDGLKLTVPSGTRDAREL